MKIGVAHKKMQEDIRCPLEYGLEIFGGKWKSRIICVLANKDKLRYSQLRQDMANRVEYSLSNKGKSVVPILQNIYKWSGIYENKDYELTLPQCKKCNYRG